MRYHYEAKQRSGESVVGDLDADSLAQARQQLRRDGLFVVSLAPLSGSGAARGPSSGGRRSRGGKMSKSDLLMVMSQLTIMCQSGVDLAEAIRNVALQAEKPALKKVLEEVHEDISAGLSFSESLRRHPHVFDETFVAGVAAGEQSGAITTVLQRLTQLIRNDMKLQNAVWSMLMYPIVLCGVTFLVLNALVFFVLPQFAKVFADLGKAAPPVTQIMLDAGATISEYKWFVLAALGGLVAAAVFGRSTAVVRRVRDHALMHGAFVRKATRALVTGRSFRLLGTMLASGVPLIDGIRLCRQTASNSLFQDLFVKIENDILNGDGLAKPLLEAKFLPSGAAQMIATAERTGNLSSVLENVGAHFEEEGERHIRDLVKVLEPAVIVGLGVVVAGVVLSVVLPLLDVSTSPG